MMAVTTQIIKREEKGDNGTGWDSRASKKSPELLPGIPDHIVITTILPKLSWTMLQRFITVSRRWLHAFQDGEIFEARISAKTTKTMFIYCKQESASRLILSESMSRFYRQFALHYKSRAHEFLLHSESRAPEFVLYSVDDNSVYYIPMIPGFIPRTSPSFTYTSVNGRLYVFGCMKSETTSKLFTYEYDLARNRGWRQRSATEHIRLPCDSAVLNGKIFVRGYPYRSALYDPDADVWSPMIRPTQDISDSRVLTHVDGLGLEGLQKVLASTGLEEDLVYQYGRLTNDGGAVEWIKNFNVKAIKKIPFFSFPSGTDIRSVEQEVKSGGGIAVTLLHGRFLKLTPDHIDAYDGHTNTWTPLHLEGPFEFSDSGWSVQNIRHSTRAVDVAIIRIKNEIYSVVRRPVTRRSNEPDHKLVLMKSEIPVHPIGRQEPSSRQQSFAPSEWRELKCKPSLFKGVLRSEPSLFEGILRCPIQL